MRVETRLARGRIVICDRYIYDLLVELSLSELYTDGFKKTILRTIPRPDLTFLMDVPPDLAHARRDLPLDSLSARRQAYLDLSRRSCFCVLTTSEDFAKNQERIRNETLCKLQKTQDNRPPAFLSHVGKKHQGQ